MADKYYDEAQVQDIIADISNKCRMPVLGAGGGYAPIGTVNFFDATVAPLGWLACDGSTHNISDYPDLATYYASVHGASNFYGGNGTTTFAVPNLQGEFLRGAGTNGHSGQGSGANVGVHQDGTNIPYTKLYAANDILQIRKTVSNADVIKTETNNYYNFVKTNGGTDSGESSYTARPTNTSFLICVKATLSDTELNNMHVYSPNEHQVAWWQEMRSGVLKQKPMYEKTKRIYNTVAWGNGTEYSLELSNVDNIFIVHGTFYDNNSGTSLYSPTLSYLQGASTGAILQVGLSTTNKGKLRFQSNTTFGVSSNRYIEVTVRYTKTTDQWQTV